MRSSKLSLLIATLLIVSSIGYAERKRQTTVLGDDVGLTHCGGSIGTFDVYAMPSAHKKGMAEVYIVPVKVDKKGDIASIALANKGLEYKELLSQVTLEDGKEIFAGYVSQEDLKAYDILSIVPANSNRGFLERESEKTALCHLPSVNMSARKSDTKGEKKGEREKHRVAGAEVGFGHCDGPIGTFDINLIPLKGKGRSTVYEVIIVAATLDAKTGLADIVAASKNLNYKVMVEKARLKKDKEFVAGYLSQAEIDNYDVISIFPHKKGVLFPETNGNKSNVCSLPTITDNSVPHDSAKQGKGQSRTTHTDK